MPLYFEEYLLNNKKYNEEIEESNETRLLFDASGPQGYFFENEKTDLDMV